MQLNIDYLQINKQKIKGKISFEPFTLM